MAKAGNVAMGSDQPRASAGATKTTREQPNIQYRVTGIQSSQPRAQKKSARGLGRM